MVAMCNTGWVCNVFWNVDPDFIVHGGKSCNFASHSSECQLKIAGD